MYETIRAHGVAIVGTVDAIEDLLDLEEARRRVADATEDDWVPWEDIAGEVER